MFDLDYGYESIEGSELTVYDLSVGMVVFVHQRIWEYGRVEGLHFHPCQGWAVIRLSSGDPWLLVEGNTVDATKKKAAR